MKSSCPKTSILLAAIFLLLSASFTFSQSLHFTGFTKYEDEALADVHIKAMQGDKVYAETFSGIKGEFSLKLAYNLDYKIVFEKEGFTPMFAEVNGAVPEDKHHYKIKYEITVPFYHKNNETVNHKAFEQAFTHIAFDGKTKFVDNNEYIKKFMVKLQTLPEKPKEKPVVTKVPEKKYHIAGKVLHNNSDKTPFKLVKIFLTDTNGKIIAKTLTNKFGVFSFPSVGKESTASLKIELFSLLDKGEALIQNIRKEIIGDPQSMASGSAVYSNNTQTKLIEKLITDEYIPFIAGKFSIDKDGNRKLLAGKNVYLYSDKNELLEKTQTNVLGNFLFSKLSPDHNFMIGVDEKDAALNDGKLQLSSSKDIAINVSDSIVNGKHLFSFLASNVESYNELLVEDTDIKMDLNGMLAGDSENNPLSNLRIAVLDNNYNIIDTARTDGKGRFSLHYLPFQNEFLFRMIDSSSLINYAGILLYDEKGTLVKYFSVKNTSGFTYKILPKERALLDELYVDDPWLTLTDKNLKKTTATSMVIIENIYFEFNKSDLLPAARQTLDKAVLALLNSPTMNIEISAHSDSKGSDDYNLKLSEKRAQSALAYIVSQGIDAKRVSAKGYGEKKLLNKCGNNVECGEEEHAKNRRLEFKIKLK